MLDKLFNQLNLAYRAQRQFVAVHDKPKTREIVDLLYKNGFLSSYHSGDQHGPFQFGQQVPVTPSNVKQRRIWIRLKYRDGLPALNKIALVSKPSRRVFASPVELKSLAAMRSTLPPRLYNRQHFLGQLTIVKTPYGILDLYEAIKKNVGGEVIGYAH